MTKPGATGEFPDGKINEHDEGEINIGLRVDGPNVILDFGKPVVWLGFPPEIARDLAAALIEHANRIDPQAMESEDF